MSLAIRLLPDPIRSVGFAAIGVAYVGVGAALSRPARIIYIVNATDEDLMLSLDGVNDHFVVVENGFILLDITANKTVDTGFFLAEGQRLYVREIVSPSSGTLYFSTFFGANL